MASNLMMLAGTRLLLLAFGALTLLAFVALFVMSSSTDRYFAWTIAPPATAAFLGAAYAAGCLLEILAVTAGTWARVRISFLMILVFVVITLAATLLHLDRFHFGSAEAVARFAAWLWLAIYVVVPIGMVVMLIRQERRREADTGPPVRLPIILSAVLVIQSVVLIVIGVILFAAPGLATHLWPWPLTPLTARMVAAWLVAFGVGSVLAQREGDLRKLDLAAWSYGLLGVLELVVVLRYAEVVEWNSPAAWGYLAIVASILFTAVFVLVRTSGHHARRARRS